MRGAYEVGILRGVVETLRRAGLPTEGAFRYMAGTSVGAINATFLAAHAHHPDLGVAALSEVWKTLHLGTHLSIRAGAFIRQLFKGVSEKQTHGAHLGASLVDARPLERLVQSSIDWRRLHENVKSQRIGGLFVAALEIATGVTIIFAEVADSSYAPSRDPRRRARLCKITSNHVLASAAIPLLFPAQRIGAGFYCDGGLRFNTPLAPVIRAGADRVFVISTTHLRYSAQLPDRESQIKTLQQYPSATFIAGKILNALLLDPIDYDLQVLERTNHLMETLEKVLTKEEQATLARVVSEQRGAPYRKLKSLIFAPSEDLGQMASEFLKANADSLDVDFLTRQAFRRVSRDAKTADWLTYLLFDGRFAEQLIELGRRDAKAREQEVVDFFSTEEPSASLPRIPEPERETARVSEH